MRQERRHYVCVRDSVLGMGLCFLLEVRVGCKSGIFSFSPFLRPTVYRFMMLFVVLWSVEHCVLEWIRKEMSFLYHRENFINL